MYPSKELREAANAKGKQLATAHDAGEDVILFTCWNRNYTGCGVHSTTAVEAAANRVSLSDRYHVVCL